MVLEHVVLNIKPRMRDAFEADFRRASSIIAASPGYIQHHLYHCLETPGGYLLLVEWETLEAHTIGFRQSEAYQQWRGLLHHYYDPFPTVEHYQHRFGAEAK